MKIAEELKAEGIAVKNIIYIDLDKRGYRSVKKPEQLETLIDTLSPGSGMKYLFIDEIQNVAGFEEVLNGYHTGI